MKPAELPEWLMVSEFAEHFRIGKTAAYEFVRTHGKELGIRRFGRTIRIPRAALDQEAPPVVALEK